MSYNTSKMERLFKFKESLAERATTYNTDVIPPSSQTSDRIVWKVPKKNILNGRSARVQLSIVTSGSNSYSTNPSGVYACIRSFCVSIGGQQICALSANASNVLTFKSNASSKPFDHPSRLLYQLGRQIDAVAEDSAGIDRVAWSPNTNVKYTTSASTTYDVMFYLSDLCELFDHELPVYSMNDDVYVELGLKDSSEFAKVCVDDGSVSGWSVSSAKMICDFVLYPDEVMNAKRNMPVIAHYTDIHMTQKTVGSGNSTQIDMTLADKALKRVTLALPMASNPILGDDSSYIKANDPSPFKYNLRTNGNQYVNEDFDLSYSPAFEFTKDASYDNEYWTLGKGCFGDESDSADSLGIYLSGNSTFGGDSTTTQEAFSGSQTWLSLSFQPDATQPASFANATKMDSKPICFQMSHNSNLSTPNALMWCDVQKLCLINPNGGVELLEADTQGEIL